MNIEDLTLKQIREIQALTTGAVPMLTPPIRWSTKTSWCALLP